MKIPTPTKVQRPELIESYIDMQVEYLHRVTGEPVETLRPKVENVVQHRYTPKQIYVVKSPSYGNTKEVKQDLLGYIREINNKLITPSGSIYKPPYETPSIISTMVVDKLAERKKIKKIQLKAEGSGDTVLANRCWYQQATIKINCNSLPGGFGSAYNIFYDKGSYNAITSTARCMIARAYTVCEQLLGGNFAWFSVEELLNHIIVNLKHMPPVQQINKCINRYKLRVPSCDELMEFYTTTMECYCPGCDLTPVSDLLKSCSTEEISFLYYYCNLRHLLWTNPHFKNYIKYVMDISNVTIDPNVTKDDAFAIDETVVTVVTVAFSEHLGNYGLVDICNDHPEYIPALVAYSKATEKKLHELDLMMETFVNTTAEIPEIQNKPNTWRTTTIVSDTDSVIFTADAWDNWYRDGKFHIDNESYQIASLVIYWLHHAVRYALKRFSVAYGVTGDAVHVLSMKNEFLYPVMMIYNIKKTYVGIQKVKEGVILPKPKPDIKGQTLRGSSVCTDALNFSEHMMIKDILEPVMDGKISARELIKKVCDYEQHIYDSLMAGELTYLKITSLKTVDKYAKPEQTSVCVAHNFWQEVMSKKYGDIHPPIKVTMFKTEQPTTAYWDWLESTSPDIYKLMRQYYSRMKSLPNQLIINPGLERVPEELTRLINTREIIYHCLTPTYNTLKRLNITVGCDDMKLLFSDVY